MFRGKDYWGSNFLTYTKVIIIRILYTCALFRQYILFVCPNTRGMNPLDNCRNQQRHSVAIAVFMHEH